MLAAIVGLSLLFSTEGITWGVKTATVNFGPQGKHTGYLARPAAKGTYPGLVVIHEWWGLNDEIKRETRRLAQQGYVALAVDLFGQSTKDPEVARKQVQALNQKEATDKLLAAAEFLRWRTYVKPQRVGSIGWCFGGAQSLRLALNDPRLAAAVVYYGQPVTDPKLLARIKAPVQGVFGEEDQSIPMEKVREFDRALAEAGVTHEIHTYPGAGHAFANPSGGDRYKADAAKDAWGKTMAFLRRNLKR